MSINTENKVNFYSQQIRTNKTDSLEKVVLKEQQNKIVENNNNNNSLVPEIPPDFSTISKELVDLQRVMRELSKTPPVDEARIAQIRAEIAQGTYKVNPMMIAQQMFLLEKTLAKKEK